MFYNIFSQRFSFFLPNELFTFGANSIAATTVLMMSEFVVSIDKNI